MKNPQDIPILLIVFNRPEKVKRLIEELSVLQPKTIYIVADGPRPHVPSDVETTAATRAAAVDIPWECDVHTNFLEENLRSRYNATEYSAVFGLDWFFKENEMGIILEDDCVPDQSFFTFCAQLLEKYKDDPKVMHISGNNFQDGTVRGDGSYYFSHFTSVWGWATWRRAWQQFHPAVADMDTFFAENRLANFPIPEKAKRFATKSYKSQKHWDSLWQYTILYANGLNITPNTNLVSNIGFGLGATNTKNDTHPLSNIPREAIGSIVHPTQTTADVEADEYYFHKVYFTPLAKRIVLKVVKIFNSLTKEKQVVRKV